MRELIGEHVAKASTKRTAPMVAEASTKPQTKVAPTPSRSQSPRQKTEPKSVAKVEPRYAVASAAGVAVRLPPPKPEIRRSAGRASAKSAPAAVTGSTEPIRPILVKTLTVRAGPQTASLAPVHLSAPAMPAAPMAAAAPAMPMDRSKPEQRPAASAAAPAAAAKAEAPATVDVPLPQRGPRPAVYTASPARPADAAPPPPPAAAPAVVPAAAAAAATPAPTLTAAPIPAPKVEPTPPKPRSGWSIQVGAFPDEQVAKERLNSVQSKAPKTLVGNDPYTESVLKGGTTYYRARFAGFDQDKAEAACKFLKRNDVECISVKN